VRSLLRRLPGFRWWVVLRLLLAGGESRRTAVALALRPRNLFQPFTTTARERYPDELAAVAAALAADGATEPRVLSFGCSSGEELLTLHEHFPDASITGIDINPAAVRAARRNVRRAGAQARIDVLRAGDAEGRPAASYDVVLALAVFRHGDLNTAPGRCDDRIRFADFERTVAGLCRTVRPGGLFVIRHANFRFGDTAVAAGFEPVCAGFPSASVHSPTPVYGRDDQILDPDLRDDGVYRRRA